jgi:plasmid stabilization system protein ParE
VTRAVFSSAANRDAKRALDYYKREAGLRVAEDFIMRLELKVAIILKSPEAYQVVVSNLRCANLDRFPYQIVYRIVDESTIRILSVRHHRQSPEFGFDR